MPATPTASEAVTTDRIRNVALVGHAGSGKTTLCEQLLHQAGATMRLGSVDQGNSILDADELSREHRHTLEPAFCHLEFQGRVVNLVDTPGVPDFLGASIACLEAVETAAIVVNAHHGIETSTRRMHEQAVEQGLGVMFIINKMDTDYFRLDSLVRQLQEAFGPAVMPINLPAQAGAKLIDCYNSERGQTDIGDVHACHVALLEAAIESDDTLLERYLAGGKVNADELEQAMDKAVAAEHVVPVLFTDAKRGVGVRELLEALAHFCPSPLLGRHRTVHHGNGPSARHEELDPAQSAGHLIAQVVRVGVDAKTHMRHAVVRVFTGALRNDSQVFVNGECKPIRLTHLTRPQGSHQQPASVALAGDLVVVPRLELHLGDVLHDREEEVHVDMPRFPQPMLAQAIAARQRSDEAKLAEALHAIAQADPCLLVERDDQTHETLIRGLGDLQLRVAIERIQRSYKVELEVRPPRIAYRETISAEAIGHHRHKKQSGGAGQFAEVKLRVLPIDASHEEWPMSWKWAVFGGAISRSFETAVRKGCEDVMQAGALAGFPMQGVRVEVLDGKEHPVDSKEVAFRAAARQAMREAVRAATPVLLEPVMDVEITAPSGAIGAISSDLATRRGRLAGQQTLPGDMTVLRAQCPLAELSDYASALSSATAGQGSYTLTFNAYEPAPTHVAAGLSKQLAKAEGEAA